MLGALGQCLVGLLGNPGLFQCEKLFDQIFKSVA